MMPSITRVAAVQAEPVWLDIDATTDKTVSLIAEAAAQGVDLIAFPETWIPGYPLFVMAPPATQPAFVARYHKNSLTIDGPQLARIRQAARAHDISVVVGFSEKDHGSLYMAQVIIGRDGEVLLHRRKLRATHGERTIFGEGDGSGLAVVDTEMGRLGALNCWEHIHPLVKFSMYAQHEQIHVAAWPSFALTGGSNMHSTETSMAVSRTYALEGGTFVIVTSQILSPAGAELFGIDAPGFSGDGGYARVYGPDGGLLTEPLDPAVEGLVICDLDLDQIDGAKAWADPVGHYSRNDVFQFSVDRTRRVPARFFTTSDSEPVSTVPDLVSTSA